MNNWLQWVFWLSVTMVVLVTIGYPLLLALLAPLFKRPWRIEDQEPTVTLVISAYNEERGIARKLENTLALDYPRDRLEIILASDGSNDRTADIAASFAARGVNVRRFPRTGKTGMQNAVARVAGGEIIVFSDANAMYRPDAIRKLVRNFADDGVSCVCGQLTYQVDSEGAGDCERKYWNYEKFMKERECMLSSLIGANGSIYAIRKSRYVEIGNDLISDFVEPLALVKAGGRVVYEPEALSIEEASPTYGVEFRRKVRILTRSIRGLLYMRALLNPFRYGIFSLQLIMHKLMRYVVPVFIVSAALSLTTLAALGHYTGLFTAAAFALALGISVNLGRRNQMRRASLLVRVCHIPYYYLMVNLAVVLAWVNIVRGKRMTFWAPERKSA